jgi:histidine phosphotransferase ChpT
MKFAKGPNQTKVRAMSEAPLYDEQPELPPAASPSAGEFAARLASRLCHDFISPASAIVSGLDLLDDPNGKDLQEEAMALIASSSKKLVDMLTFARAAYGGSASAESFESGQLETLARSVFDHIRPDLDWAIAPQTFDKAAARVLLNLAEMGGGVLPMGGTARVTSRTEDGWTAIMVESKGPRLRLDPQVTDGLKGEPAPAGPAGKWVQAYYVYNQVREAGGVVASEQTEERVAFTAALPAAAP